MAASKLARIGDVYRKLRSGGNVVRFYDHDIVEASPKLAGLGISIVANRGPDIVNCVEAFLRDSYGGKVDIDGLVLIKICVSICKFSGTSLRVAPVGLQRSRRGIYGLELCFPTASGLVAEVVSLWFVDSSADGDKFTATVPWRDGKLPPGGRRAYRSFATIGAEDVSNFVEKTGDSNTLHDFRRAGVVWDGDLIVPGLQIAEIVEMAVNRLNVEDGPFPWLMSFQHPVRLSNSDDKAVLFWPRRLFDGMRLETGSAFPLFLSTMSGIEKDAPLVQIAKFVLE